MISRVYKVEVIRDGLSSKISFQLDHTNEFNVRREMLLKCLELMASEIRTEIVNEKYPVSNQIELREHGFPIGPLPPGIAR